MLWGNLGEVLVEKKTKQFAFSDKVYLSSTSSSVILDDAEIPAIKALKDVNRTKTGWNFPSCGSEGCRKGVTWQKRYFFFESCNRQVDFPMLRYRLELDVSDVTATFESFTCWQLNPEEVCGDSVGSNTLDALDGVQTYRLSRPVRAPTVATPIKPSEPKRIKSLVIEDSDVEASGDSSGYVRRIMPDPISDSKKQRKRVVNEVSSKDVSGNTLQNDSTDWLAYADASSE
ncbi:nucleic acid-binding, OB-fold protein [Tanacetum coccineum]|uniref:Nucleic acid-binding, OB-fold protein n=1 Tax=Tanacetum coccineum TaxID=301880 RepID=A0ABQ5GAV2_9ASTR